MIRRILGILAVVALLFGLAAGCVSESSSDNDTAAENDEETSAQQLETYQDTQPVPRFDWSQLRQNLIELQTAQAQTTQTTSFFFNVGTPEPISECSSLGFPIPASYQLTNPQQVVTPGPRERGTATVGQLESTGVYTGDTTGTYVICLNDAGQAYAQYWEGFVATIAGNAQFVNGKIELIGAPSFDFSEGEDG